MFKINDYVVSGSLGVCQVIDIINERSIGGEVIDYYALRPVFSNSNNMMTIKTRVNNPKVAMREVISKDDVAGLIATLPDQETVWIADSMQRNEQFKSLLRTGEISELIKIVKTLYLEKKANLAIGKNLTRTDEEMYKVAEKQLVEEFALVLDIPTDAVLPYILKQLPA